MDYAIWFQFNALKFAKVTKLVQLQIVHRFNLVRKSTIVRFWCRKPSDFKVKVDYCFTQTGTRIA